MRLQSISTGLILAFAAALILTAGNTAAGRFPPDLTDCLNRISGYIYNDRFDRAEGVIDSLQQNDHNDAFCHFFRAALYQARMMAAESDFLREEYFAALDSLEDDAQKALALGPDSALAYLYLGHAHAFRALFYGRSGNFLKALKSGLGARKAYSEGYAIDSAFHDIALGLGSYRYWKSVKTKALSWTPLFKNERQNGMDLLRLAADSSEISRDAATVALIWVYINEERFTEAIWLAEAMRRKYPEGLTFLWALGEAYYKMDDCREAAKIYEIIFDRLRREPGNYYNIIEAAYYLSLCYRQATGNQPDHEAKLVRLQGDIQSFPIPEETRQRQKKKIKAILK